jgi:vacuolar-type H+-ATPase subunit H
MAQEEVDLGEIIRDLLDKERGMIENFEKTEMHIERAKKDIDSKVSKILKEEREKAKKDAEGIIKDKEKLSLVEVDKILKKQKKEIKDLEDTVKKQEKKIVDISLQKIVEEVQDVISRETP